MSFEERTCWFRSSLTRLSCSFPSFRQDSFCCAAGSMNAQGMKEHGGVAACDGGSSIFETMFIRRSPLPFHGSHIMRTVSCMSIL